MIIFSILIVLGLIIISPQLFNQLDKQYICNRYQIEDYQEKSYNVDPVNLSIDEKVDLLSQYRNNPHIILSTHQEVLDDHSIRDINQYLNQELIKLKKLDIIPQISLKHEFKIYYLSSQTLSDVSQAQHYVLLWHIYAMQDNISYEFLMDANTQQIYELTIRGDYEVVVKESNREEREKTYLKEYLQVDGDYQLRFPIFKYKGNQYFSLIL